MCNISLIPNEKCHTKITNLEKKKYIFLSSGIGLRTTQIAQITTQLFLTSENTVFIFFLSRPLVNNLPTNRVSNEI